jgi:hypothetical protein
LPTGFTTSFQTEKIQREKKTTMAVPSKHNFTLYLKHMHVNKSHNKFSNRENAGEKKNTMAAPSKHNFTLYLKHMHVNRSHNKFSNRENTGEKKEHRGRFLKT